MTPFDYPRDPIGGRHAPTGYLDIDSFRPWIRDEFTFRCIYCLRRERWEPDAGIFEIDHFAPVARTPKRRLEYSNLLYSCRTCNAAKGTLVLPDPRSTLLSEQVCVENDGLLRPRTAPANFLVRILDLNDPMYVTWRMRMIRIVVLASARDPALFRDLLAYPDDLPDLENLRPPAGNTRPGGVSESHSARARRGELPETY